MLRRLMSQARGFLLRTRAATPTNLLSAPGFEGEFVPYQGVSELKTQPPWVPWWVDEAHIEPTWKRCRPEYGKPHSSDTLRIRTGTGAQQYGLAWATCLAGIYQRVSGITIGDMLKFIAHGYTLSFGANSTVVDPETGLIGICRPNMKVGIDPLGGTDPFADSVVWGPWHQGYVLGEHTVPTWHQFEVQARAQASTVSVWTYSEPDYAVQHTGAQWDDMSLMVVSTEEAVAPRIPYHRIYVLFHKSAGAQWKHYAAQAIGRDDRPADLTLGNSGDDSFYGPGLLSRTILAVNPSLWTDDLEAFGEEWYPGAVYVPINAATPAEMLEKINAYLGSGGNGNGNGNGSSTLQLYSQRDPRWKDLVYAGGKTFGQAGCYVVAVAMVASMAGYTDTPPEVAAKLRAAGCFSGALLAYPQKIPNAYPNLKWHGSVNWRNVPADLAQLGRWLPVIIETEFTPGGAEPPADQHFVLALQRTNGDLQIADPWDGTKTRLLERYALSYYDLKRSVYGMRILKPKTVSPLRSRLGIHTIRPNETGRFAREAREGSAPLSVIKVVDDLGQTQPLSTDNPNSKIMGRIKNFTLDDDQLRTGNLLRIAEDMMAELTVKVEEHPGVDYWEVTNEVDPSGPDLYAKFAQFHFHLMDIAEEEGYKIAIGSFNCGTPEWDEILAWVETGVCGRAKEGGHILAWHEGVFGQDAPINKWWNIHNVDANGHPTQEETGDTAPGGWIPGGPVLAGAGALCFRYRFMYHLLKQRNEVIPLVITEFYPGGGHQQDGTSPAEVVERVRWYDREAKKDDYFWSFLPFTLGPTGQWTASNYEWAYPALVDYCIAEADGGGPEPPPRPQLLLGMHDASGGQWMINAGIQKGSCLVHHQIQSPQVLNYRWLQTAGITVIARLNWGYADGTGTFPPADKFDQFVDACVSTIVTSYGVDYWHVGNEPNNRQEWPGFGSSSETPLTPAYTLAIYNEIRGNLRASGSSAKIGPPPLDPYFGPGSDNGVWWRAILDGISGADALFIHAKTQTNNPQEVWSYAKFSDDPLKWQYLHMRVIETYLGMVPTRFKALPVFITECNPQHKSVIGGAMGWQAGNAEWIRQAASYLRKDRRITGACFYRYEAAGDQAAFGLENFPQIRQAIKEEAG